LRERNEEESYNKSFIPTHVFVRRKKKQLHHEAVLEISVWQKKKAHNRAYVVP